MPLGADPLGAGSLGTNFRHVCCFNTFGRGAVIATQIPYSAPPVPMLFASMPANKTPLIVTQSAPLPHPVGVPGAEVPMSNSSSTGNNRNAVQPPGGPPGEPDDYHEKTKRDREIDAKR